jgi:hypothetical protein
MAWPWWQDRRDQPLLKRKPKQDFLRFKNIFVMQPVDTKYQGPDTQQNGLNL